MQPFNVLAQETPIFGKKFLEASAGTGKTFTIEHLTHRFLEAGVRLDQILIVTFTRAATRELKMRIRAQLEKKGMEEALVYFERAQIYTIHGFCHTMLQEFAMEGDISEKKDGRIVMRHAIKDFLQEHLDETFSGQQIELMLRSCGFEIDRLVTKLLDFIERRKGGSNHPTFQESLAAYRNWLEHHPSIDLLSAYREAAPSFKKMGGYEAQVELLASQMEKRSCTVEEFDELLGTGELFLEQMVAKNLKVKATLPKTAPFFEQLKGGLLPIFEAATRSEYLLERLADLCKPVCLRALEEEEIVTPDRLLYRMEELASNPIIAQQIRAKYRVAIIDEFQDTDQIQWNIFRTLFLSAEEPIDAVYLIGDPKQSIYGFRNADLYTYIAAKGEVGEENSFSLDTNFRSEPGLVQALNTLFSPTHLGAWIDLPALEKSLEYSKVKAGRSEGRGDFTIVLADRGEEELLPYIAHEIQKTQGGEIAILVRDRYQGRRVATFLKGCGIRAVVKRSMILPQTAAFQWMKHDLGGEMPKLSGDPILDTVTEKLVSHQIQTGATFPQLRLYLDELESPDREEDPELHVREMESDADVTILTMHMSKGLEFDVVFALGLAEPQSMENREAEAETMRQFYVALTRGKSHVYLPIVLENGRKKGVSAAQLFASKLTRTPLEEVTEEKLLEAVGRMQSEAPISVAYARGVIPEKRELEQAAIVEKGEEKSLPTYSEHLLSFSSLAKKGESEIAFEGGKEKNFHTLPAGAATGTLLHTILQQAVNLPAEAIPSLVASVVAGTEFEEWRDVICEMVKAAIALLPHPIRNIQPEWEFLFPSDGNLIKGFVDLLFEKEGKYYIVDWKSNWLGASDEMYTEDHLKAAMEREDYWLQAEIYSEALKRYLRQFGREENFGGTIYIFLRGKAALSLFSAFSAPLRSALPARLCADKIPLPTLGKENFISAEPRDARNAEAQRTQREEDGIDQIIAEKVGGDSALVAELMKATREGHLCIQVEEEKKVVFPLLQFKDLLYFDKAWKIETIFVEQLKRLLAAPSTPLSIPVLHAALTEEQREAIRTVFGQTLTVITGGPGTGKTFTAAELVNAFREANPDARVVLAAPTGKAAARLGGVTLHALLQIRGVDDFQREAAPLFADLVIVDECSMIDASLFARLLRSIRSGTRLVLMGDGDQLPPVGSGTLFADLTQLIPCARLTQTLRSEDSALIDLARSIQAGGDVESLLKPFRVDLGIGGRSTSAFYDELWNFASEKFRSAQFQILCSVRRGPRGADALNEMFARRFEGSGRPVPIIVVRSRAELNLYNGETGLLEGDRAHFSNGRTYSLSELPAYEIAYCLSIHKSQGSEYDEALLLLPKGSEAFGREILYTAVTRVRKKLYVDGEVEHLTRASRKISGLHARVGGV
jgi:exodeoxyribonuclease V alpha subunit